MHVPWTCPMSKAFEMVEWGELFATLREKKIHPIFLSLLLTIYRNQQGSIPTDF